MNSRVKSRSPITKLATTTNVKPKQAHAEAMTTPRHRKLNSNTNFFPRVKSSKKTLVEEPKSTKVAIWKTKSPRRVNITIWIVLNELLSCALVMQSKLPSHILSPRVCSLCLQDSEDLVHLFFTVLLQENVGLTYLDPLTSIGSLIWFDLFGSFNINWVFDSYFRRTFYTS